MSQPYTREVSSIELERRGYRRTRKRQSILVSVGSTLLFAAVISVLLINSPGWSRVSETFFDLDVAVGAFPRVIEGLWLNIQVLFFAVIGVAIFGTLLAISRTLKGAVFTPIRLLAAGYTDLFRGIPVLLVLYLVGFGIPGLELTGRMPPQFWGTIALVLCYSAYVAEVLRAGIDAVHPSQRLAARSLGLSHSKTLRLVVLPQAVRKVTPALMNDFVSMQKDVGLISVLGAVDAIRAAQIEVASAYNFTPYVLAGVLFVLFSLPFIRLTDWMTARAQKREQIGGVV
ncbi:amino acid ABC transporter membrane protein (PAAT family) [Leucobacter luti]|uniref:amino acid ABC transporter permease n=1 Tax=Leucobacter luti TaxID=340320 RepID=UPI00104D6ABF|nr:amino acid ABC transporter permease [Leucobacter luti]MCW2287450.1 polar amino acid transport system permease protein [Leucobacter luti]TCK41672.1 amino acid ABC transporter membrane protein (PAAT family) [Leucobacter luti]